MAFEIGVGFFDLVPSAKGLTQNISKELGGTLDEAAKTAGAKASKSFGDIFSKGLHGAGGALAGATKEITASLANVAGFGVLGAGLITAASVKGFAGFEQSLNVLQATAHATGAQMTAVSAEAKTLGADMSLPATSAADAANAMTDLARGGLSVADAMGAAKGTLELVAAATVSEGEAAIDVASELKAFGLAGNQATHVADLLTGAITNSGTDLATFANGLSQVSAVASTAHISIDDTVTAVAELVKNGLDASVAGTTLKEMIIKLTGPTKKAGETMASLGLKVFDAQGKVLPFRDIIQNLSKATQGLTDKQRDAAFTTIFGARAINSANIFANQGVAAFDSLAISVGKPGSAADIAAAKMKGLSGTLEGIKSVVETIGLDIGQILQPALQAAEGAISDEVQSLNVFADAVTAAVTPDRVVAFGHIVGSVLGDVRTAINGVEGPVAGMGAALALTFGSKLPIIGNFVAPLGLAEGAFLGIVASSSLARGSLVNFGKDLVGVGVNAAPELIGALRTIEDSVGPAFARIVDGADKAALTALPALARAASDLAPAIGDVITQGSRLAEEVLPAIGQDIADLAPVVGTVLGGALHIAAGGLKLLADNASVTVPIIVGLGTAFAAFRLSKIVSEMDITRTALAAFGRASETFKVEFVLASAEEGAAATTMGAAVATGTAAAKAGMAAFGATLSTALPFAAVALGVGLLTKVFTDNAARARENKQAIDSLTTAMEDQHDAVASTAAVLAGMIQQNDGMVATMDKLHVSVTTVTDAFAKGPGAVEALRNSLFQQGKQAGLTDDQINDLVGGIIRLQQKYDPAAAKAAAWTRVQGAAGEAAGTTTEKIEGEKQALDDLVQATFASFNSQIAYSRSLDATKQAATDLTQAQFFATQAGAGNLAVQQKLNSVALDAQSTIVSQADNAVRVATDNAKATGATLSYAQSLGVYRDELLKIKAANPELAASVDALIGQLDANSSKAGLAGTNTADAFVHGVSTGIAGGAPASADDVANYMRALQATAALKAAGLDFSGIVSPITQGATKALSDAKPALAAAGADAGTSTASSYNTAAAQGLTAGTPALADAAQGTVSAGLGAALLSSLAEAFGLGEDVASGIASGVRNGSGTLSGAVSQIVAEGLAAGRATAESKSPSKLFARELGLPLAQGVAAGIAAGASDVDAAASKLITDAASTASGIHAGFTASLSAFTAQVAALEAKAAASTKAGGKDAKDLTTNAEQARGAILGVVSAALAAEKDMADVVRSTAVAVGIGAAKIIASLSPTGDVFKAAASDAAQFASTVKSAFDSSFNIVSDFQSAVEAQTSKVADAQQQANTALQAAQDQVNTLRGDYVDAYSGIVQAIGTATAAQIANRNFSLDALKDISAGAQELASAMRSSFSSATDVVSAFGSETFVTGNQVLSFFTNNVKAAQKWATDLKTLAAAGLDQGILQQLAQAGPKAEPLVKGLLQDVANGNLDAINKAQSDLQTILGDTIDSVGASLVPAFAQGANVGKSISDGIASGLVGSSASIQSQLQGIIAATQASNAALVASAEASTVDIVALFQKQVDAAKTWSDELSTLAKSGIDQGLLRQLAEAGPQAEPIIKDLLSQVAQGNLGVIDQAESDLGTLLQNTIDLVATQIAPALVQGQNLGASIDQGMVAGIVAGSPAIQDAIRAAVQGAIDAAREQAGIHSPSQVFAELVGAPIAEGTALGIRKSAFLVANESASMVKAAIPSAALASIGAGRAVVPSPSSGDRPLVAVHFDLDGKTVVTQVLDPWASQREAKQRRDLDQRINHQ